MIGKISNVSSFEAVLRYVVNKQKDYTFAGKTRSVSASKRIGGQLFNHSIDGMVREFSVLKNKLKHPAKHLSISLPIGETVDDSKWLKIARDAVHGLKYDDNQWICYRHSDAAHDHVHIVINRKNFKGKTVDDGLERKYVMELMRELEADYKLTAFKNTPDKIRITKYESKLMKENIKRKKKNIKVIPTDKEELHEIIKNVTANSDSWFDFPKLLEEKGVLWNPRLNELGAETGARYEYKGKTYSGSKVGFSILRVEQIFIDKAEAAKKALELEHELKSDKAPELTPSEFALHTTINMDIDHLKEVLPELNDKQLRELFDEFKALALQPGKMDQGFRVLLVEAFKEDGKRREGLKEVKPVEPTPTPIPIPRETPPKVSAPTVEPTPTPIPTPPKVAEPTRVAPAVVKPAPSSLDLVYAELRELFKGDNNPRDVRLIIEKYDKSVVENIDPNMFVGSDKARVIKAKEKVLGIKDRDYGM